MAAILQPRVQRALGHVTSQILNLSTWNQGYTPEPSNTQALDTAVDTTKSAETDRRASQQPTKIEPCGL